jgi:hypothetical protein
LAGDENHLTATHSLNERRRQGRQAVRRGGITGQASAIGAAHGGRLDLHQHALVGEIRQRHGGDGRRRAQWQSRADAGDKGVLVNGAIVDIEGGEHDHIRQISVEALEHPAHIGHDFDGLGRQIAGVAHIARRIQVDLTANENHIAAAQAVLVRQMDRPVPVALGP